MFFVVFLICWGFANASAQDSKTYIALTPASPEDEINSVSFSPEMNWVNGKKPVHGAFLKRVLMPEVDWRLVAKAAHVPITKKEMSAAFIQKLRDNSYQYKYDADIDTSISTGYYYFIGPRGVEELQLKKLQGVVRYDYGSIDASLPSQDSTHPIRAEYYGDVLATFRSQEAVSSNDFGFVLFRVHLIRLQVTTL